MEVNAVLHDNDRRRILQYLCLFTPTHSLHYTPERRSASPRSDAVWSGFLGYRCLPELKLYCSLPVLHHLLLVFPSTWRKDFCLPFRFALPPHTLYLRQQYLLSPPFTEDLCEWWACCFVLRWTAVRVSRCSICKFSVTCIIFLHIVTWWQ